ncbi:TetR/AcrR family transcriptional regulator [Mycobacterium sp. CBMA271]|uniref:TetR/AcrR family transcriptional regulator n=1 Tax=unclassified Mycobacteroides TaxID=2618759 RepID=UPI0012DDE335|nr:MULTISPECIES: TetR family transcriptional regulator [unclassified Mycobacteroides]MUM17730.1 TetR family transcriptional regulator [Mycobacteroides sp. CBMA 326]MUM22995.1 TetR/AcrR family transcriptional regulator [Mycobacteroides sp. CBMA 271]
MTPKRPGRRPGASKAREEILASARKLFSASGIDKTSMRAIAADAGVDPALIHHYFGTKLDLFRESIKLPADPELLLEPLRQTKADDIGHMLPKLLVTVWDSELGAGMLATVRSQLSGTDTSLVRVFFRDVVLKALGDRVDNPVGSGVLRAGFAATQMLGIVMARYIIKLEPIASMSADEIADMVGPNIQRYLTGDLPSES